MREFKWISTCGDLRMGTELLNCGVRGNQSQGETRDDFEVCADEIGAFTPELNLRIC